MSLYFATFGAGNALDGKVLPINANCMSVAREYMYTTYNNHYCTVYTEAEWNAWKERAHKEHVDYMVETPLDAITVFSSYDSKPCDACPNNPANGGSGACNCTLGEPKVTC